MTRRARGSSPPGYLRGMWFAEAAFRACGRLRCSALNHIAFSALTIVLFLFSILQWRQDLHFALPVLRRNRVARRGATALGRGRHGDDPLRAWPVGHAPAWLEPPHSAGARRPR